MNHVEAAVMDRVARLYSELFTSVSAYCQTHASFLDLIISRFDREIQFYVSYLDYLEPLRREGLNFCYPIISSESKEVTRAGASGKNIT